MSSQSNANLLRYALLADAVASGGTGLLMVLGAPALSGLLGIPEPLLRWAGILLLPFAILVGLAARHALPPRNAAIAIVAVNALWVADSAALLASGWIAPNGLGIAFVSAQALAVGALTVAQALGVRALGRTKVALA